MEKRTTKPSGGRDKKNELTVKYVPDDVIIDLTKVYFEDDHVAVKPRYTINDFSEIGRVQEILDFKAGVMDYSTFADGKYVEKPTKEGTIEIKNDKEPKERKSRKPGKRGYSDKEESIK